MLELFPLESSWVVALAASAIAMVLLLEMARSLPGQNILLIAFCLLAAEAGIEYFFIKYNRSEVIGPLWYFLTGAALLWATVVLAGRRLAQLILRPWRRDRFYGLWLLGMSMVAVAMFQIGWPCLVAEGPDAEPVDFSRVAIMSAIRGVSALILLAGLSPWFIRKRPVSQPKQSELAQQPQNEAEQKTD